MDKLNNYMEKLHSTLINDYSTPCGKYSESCSLIAIEIARIILEIGKKPYLAKFNGELVDSINTKILVPKQFGGRVTWGGHIVCCVGNLVYDPMISVSPIDVKDYCKNTFEDKVNIGVFIPVEQIEKFVNR